jgi:hypothetical protein
MNLDSRLRRLGIWSGLAGALALVAATGGASAAPQGSASATIPGCTPATNLESIVDDSGSMSGNDALEGRRQMIEILADLDRKLTQGAVEFGSDADALFAPLLPTLGKNTTAVANGMLLIDADNGGTDYNAGFALAGSQNPSANARMFLSDGENGGTYNNGHLSPRIKTYVVGFGGALSPAGAALLGKIATDTGGALFTPTTPQQIIDTAMTIHARLNCQTDPIAITQQFNSQGQVRSAAFKATGPAAEIATTNPVTGQVILPLDFTQGGGGAGKSVAVTAKKRKGGVKAKTTRGDNYVSVRLTGLRKGKRVRFKVKAKRLTVPSAAVTSILP